MISIKLLPPKAPEAEWTPDYAIGLGTFFAADLSRWESISGTTREDPMYTCDLYFKDYQHGINGWKDGNAIPIHFSPHTTMLAFKNLRFVDVDITVTVTERTK